MTYDNEGSTRLVTTDYETASRQSYDSTYCHCRDENLECVTGSLGTNQTPWYVKEKLGWNKCSSRSATCFFSLLITQRCIIIRWTILCHENPVHEWKVWNQAKFAFLDEESHQGVLQRSLGKKWIIFWFSHWYWALFFWTTCELSDICHFYNSLLTSPEHSDM